jgi:hypothetical protein
MDSPYDKFYAQNLEQATAQKPFIQQDVDVAQEHTRNIQNVAMQYAQQNEIPYEQSLKLMNARWDNQQKQKAFAIEDETRGLNAHNAALDAGIALRQVDLTAPDAPQKISSIKSSLAPHTGTKEADPIFKEADTMLNTTKGFEKERLAQKTQERLLEVEKNKEYRESPAGQREVLEATMPIRVESAIKEKRAAEEEAEKLLKAKEQTPLYQAREKLAFGRQARDVTERIKSTLSPVGLTEKSFSLPAIETDEKGRPKLGGEYVVLTDMVKNKKMKSNPIPKTAFEEAKSKYDELSQEREALYTSYPNFAPQKEKDVPAPSTDEQPSTTPMVKPATEEPKYETIEEQTRRLNPEKFKQESDASVVNAATELSKIENEFKKVQEMGADKYKELYGIDPSSYAVKLEQANRKFKKAIVSSLLEETGDDKEKAMALAKERGYQF